MLGCREGQSLNVVQVPMIQLSYYRSNHPLQLGVVDQKTGLRINLAIDLDRYPVTVTMKLVTRIFRRQVIQSVRGFEVEIF